MTTDGDLLLAAIGKHPGERDPKLRYIDWALENEEYVRSRIEFAMAWEPRLTVLELQDRDRTPDFEDARAGLFGAIREWAACRAWLASRKKRRRLDWTRDAYAVLHTAAWELPDFLKPWKKPHEPGEYCSACWRCGPLIAAAIDAGFECDDWFGRGSYLNVGDRLWPADKPKPPKAKRWKPGYQWMEDAGIDWRTAT